MEKKMKNSKRELKRMRINNVSVLKWLFASISIQIQCSIILKATLSDSMYVIVCVCASATFNVANQ